MQAYNRGAASLLSSDWIGAESRLLAAIPQTLRNRVKAVLADPRSGGRGLRAMVTLLVNDHRPLPKTLPSDLVNIYLYDDEAEPLHDCECCGLLIPVRAGFRAGHEANPEHIYYPACPQCGGRTGRFAYWSRSNHAQIGQVTHGESWVTA